jgi:hypothetical protein
VVSTEIPFSGKENIMMKQRSAQADRRHRAAWAVVLVAALLVALAAPTITALAGGRGNPNPGVLPPHAKPHGMSYGEWAAEWWTWALNCPADQCPVMDTTGEFAHVNQSGSVWFLAGTFLGEATRTCTVPAGKSLYIPLINSMWNGDDPEEEDALREGVNDALDAVTELYCTINGEPLEELFAYRADSPLFDFPVTEGSFADLFMDVGEYPSVAGAYAVLLAPLPPGEYIIEFGGAKEDGWSVSVTYLLTVEGAPDDD